MILKEQPDKIFTAVSDISPELPLTRSGDKVEISYLKVNRKVINISKFDNLNYTQK